MLAVALLEAGVTEVGFHSASVAPRSVFLRPPRRFRAVTPLVCRSHCTSCLSLVSKQSPCLLLALVFVVIAG